MLDAAVPDAGDCWAGYTQSAGKGGVWLHVECGGHAHPAGWSWLCSRALLRLCVCNMVCRYGAYVEGHMGALLHQHAACKGQPAPRPDVPHQAGHDRGLGLTAAALITESCSEGVCWRCARPVLRLLESGFGSRHGIRI